VAGLVRQNGLVVDAAAALALAWTARGGGWKASLAWGLGGLVVVFLLGQAIGAAVQPRGTSMAGDTDKGLRVLQHYDIVGVVARDPNARLDVIERADPKAAARIRSQGVQLWSPERVDTLTDKTRFARTLWRLPKGVAGAQWRDIVLHQPVTYLKVRADVFRWLVAPPAIERCLPFTVGVDGPVDKMAMLNLPHGERAQDSALADYANGFLHTPVFSHVTYALAAVAVGLVLLLRREAADMVMVGLMLGALGFTASFFVISIACDYRYLYFLDLAAMVGLLYVALDPPSLRSGPRDKAAGVGPNI
jgi:hypothetical protein